VPDVDVDGDIDVDVDIDGEEEMGGGGDEIKKVGGGVRPVDHTQHQQQP